jgi:copper chaperone CopZ
LIKLQNTNHLNQTKIPYITIKIEGMTCNHCKTTVESHLSSLSGINEVNVNLTDSTAALKGESIDLDKVKSCIRDLGYNYIGKIR